MAIIYKILFDNGKSYIGYTQKSLEERIKEHVCAAETGSQYLIHKALRKYITFCVSVLEESTDNQYLLSVAEHYHIVKEQSHFTENGYNMTWGGQAGSNLAWMESLSDEEWEAHIAILKENLSKTWQSEKRFVAIRNSWNDNRKEQAKTRMIAVWNDRTDQTKEHIAKLISEKMAERRAAGKYDHVQKIITEKARQKVSGTKWYNDGSKNFRLKPDDERTLNLKVGKI